MDVGLQHLFYAFAVVWILHLGYLLSLAFRQKQLRGEVRALKDALAHKAAE